MAYVFLLMQFHPVNKPKMINFQYVVPPLGYCGSLLSFDTSLHLPPEYTAATQPCISFYLTSAAITQHVHIIACPLLSVSLFALLDGSQSHEQCVIYMSGIRPPPPPLTFFFILCSLHS